METAYILIYMCLLHIQAARVIAQLLFAVEHLHSQGFVHCDIKLENIMYTGPDKDGAKTPACDSFRVWVWVSDVIDYKGLL